jgi:hypothetical protein
MQTIAAHTGKQNHKTNTHAHTHQNTHTDGNKPCEIANCAILQWPFSMGHFIIEAT